MPVLTEEEMRERAAECRALAKDLPDGDKRDALLRVAAILEELAADPVAVKAPRMDGAAPHA